MSVSFSAGAGLVIIGVFLIFLFVPGGAETIGELLGRQVRSVWRKSTKFFLLFTGLFLVSIGLFILIQEANIPIVGTGTGQVVEIPTFTATSPSISETPSPTFTNSVTAKTATATLTETLTASQLPNTPTLTLTVTPTLPNYSSLKPRNEPSLEQNFAFFDEFPSDINDWYFNAKNQDALMEVKDNTLQIRLGNSHVASYFLAGCTAPNCVIQPSNKENLTYKFRIRSILDVPGVLAGIAFGSESILSETNNYYLLLASNKGQIRLYSTFDGVDLYNDTKSLYAIPRNGAIDIQIDFYHKECPANAERCFLIFINDNIITEKPIIINKPPHGYFGIYVLPGNTQGYIKTIIFEDIKIWYEP